MAKVIWGHILMVLGAVVIAYWPKVFTITGDEMGFCVIAYCVIFPIITFAACFLCGLRGVLYGLMCAFFTAFAAALLPYPYFGSPWRETILLPEVGAILGVALSTLADRFRKKKPTEDPDYERSNP